MSIEDEQNRNATALIAYRLEQAERKLDVLDGKLLDLSKGFIEMKVELQHVAKNEGKTSGAISGVVTSIVVALLIMVAQAALNIGS